MNQCVAAGVFPNNQVWLTVRRPSSSVRCPSTIQRSSTLSPRSRTSSCGSEIPTSALTLSARGSSRTSRRRKALERSASRPSPSRSFPGQSGEEFGTPESRRRRAATPGAWASTMRFACSSQNDAGCVPAAARPPRTRSSIHRSSASRPADMRESRFFSRFSLATRSGAAASSGPFERSPAVVLAARRASQSVTQAGEAVTGRYGPEGQEEQADGVFAGLFAARAGALHRQVGEVYPHLVDRAAPALAPEGLLIAAEALPGPWCAKLLAGGGHLRIRRERRNALGCQARIHTSHGMGRCCGRIVIVESLTIELILAAQSRRKHR